MSKLESKTYEKLRDNKLIVFRLKDVSLLLHLDKTSTYNLIKAMKKKAIIKKISGSSYAFSDADDLVIACNAHFPSYISEDKLFCIFILMPRNLKFIIQILKFWKLVIQFAIFFL